MWSYGYKDGHIYYIEANFFSTATDYSCVSLENTSMKKTKLIDEILGLSKTEEGCIW